jgi:hypothetical protein
MKLKPVHARALVRLAFSEGGRVDRLKDLKLELKKKDRQELVQAKLLETGRARGSQWLELTESGWRWVSENLRHQMPRGSGLLSDVLGYIDRFLKANNGALADLIGARNIRTNPTAAGPTGIPEEGIKQLILQESLALNGGRANERVRLSQLRMRLSVVPRHSVDRALFELQDAGLIVLYPLDYLPDITAEDEGACVRVGGEPRHILYVRK